ncbi:AAA domain-containing protein [Flexibacter flexilis DSM 6793]|uniref:AAA domain-containing protein n=1 Tax=Flexibacter flexilis DSM 6793 TaxID=927664 RepID=A0A1I1LXB3_9BACT|nr:ATP-binding protein [Flexibacter flexilis]SFC74963.1 AAA domain-containing protein [Flexibacter flexilis DSM 6793]
MQTHDNNKPILENYLRKLTNLSNANKSLLLLRLSKSQDIGFQDFDFLLGKKSFDVLRPLLEHKKQISLCAVHDPRHAANNLVSSRLHQIWRKTQQIAEERGTQDLFVGYPFVEGCLPNGTRLRCPLLFFPVRLEAQNNLWQLELLDESLIGFNKSFLLAYAQFSGVELSQPLWEFSGEQLPDGDALTVRTFLYNLLKDSNIQINFGRETLADTLLPFTDFQRKDYDEAHSEAGVLRLQPQAVLGLFPQADSYLLPDYEFFIKNNITLSSLFHSESTPHAPIREEQIFAPFALDASQEQVLRAVKSGQSLVVQGPPGTGKSELICNLAADAIAKGKRVLVVSQKRAALDVVYQRFVRKNLQQFVGLVHDFLADRPAIYAQLAVQISQTDTYKQHNSSLNAIALEQDFVREARLIDQHAQQLEAYKIALFSTHKMGLSPKTLYLTSRPSAQPLDLGEAYKHFDAQTWYIFERKFQQYAQYVDNLQNVDNLWLHRLNFAHFSAIDKQKLLETLADIQQQRSTLQQDFERLEAVNQYFIQKENFEQILEAIGSEQEYALLAECLRNQVSSAVVGKSYQHFVENFTEKPILQATNEATTLAVNIAQWQELLPKAQQAADAHAHWWTRTIWQLSNPNKKTLLSLAAANGIAITDLPDKIKKRIDYQKFIAQLQQKKGYGSVPPSLQPETVAQSLQALQKVSRWAELWRKTMPDKNRIAITKLTWSQWCKALTELIQKTAFWQNKISQWHTYLAFIQIEILLQCPENEFSTWKAYYQQHFDNLVAFDKLCTELSTTEKQVIHDLEAYLHKNATSYPHFLHTWSVLDNAWRLAWLADLEKQFPELKFPSELAFVNTVEQLQTSVARKQTLSAHLLELRAKERTYRLLQYNRLGNMVSYRELYHQTTKKRRIWPLRRLLATYANEIFELCPCWLASPETVSAIFPQEQCFDLVIFDEASQCFAEKGLPAMFRGKQVVVAGDEKQLSPHHLYQLRWDGDPTDEPLAELDSLLDLALQFLPQYQLTGHYRSRTPDLIDFSNLYFYRSSLQILPHRDVLNHYEPAIKYLKINGLWENNHNTTEAEHILQLLQSISQNPALKNKSVGIVTFNAQQQNLILDCWEKANAQQRIEVKDLFVKNIENVQGDERDIIIFSVGYAPNAQGRVMAQFGSLNAEGGQNRLNVAVTRAREQIWVVCSFWPQQLQTDHTQHEGAKLFKKYLEYALLVSEGKWQPQPYPKNEKYYESLAEKLSQQQDHLQAVLPFADLMETTENQYKSLVLTDDNLFYQSLSAKDWFVYRPAAFARQNWPFRWEHSRNWWLRQ